MRLSPRKGKDFILRWAMSAYSDCHKPTRYEDFECSCGSVGEWGDRYYNFGCKVCQGYGRYSVILSRRQQHVLLVVHQRSAKMLWRVYQDDITRFRKQHRQEQLRCLIQIPEGRKG